MNDSYKNNKFILIAVLALLFWVIIVGVVVYISPPKIVAVEPENGSKNVSLEPNINLTFSKKINSNQINNIQLFSDKIGVKNELIGFSDGKILKIKSKEGQKLFPNTEYKLLIFPIGITGIKGRGLEILFITRELNNLDEISPYLERLDTERTDQFEEGYVEGFEFVKDIPIEKDFFTIVHAFENRNGTTEIQVQYSNKKPISVINELIKDWLTSVGANPENVIISEVPV